MVPSLHRFGEADMWRRAPLAIMIALQAIRDPCEEVESHTCEKLSRTRDWSTAMLRGKECQHSQSNEGSRIALAGIAGGLHCHSHGL
jgi:hypothetical protein